MQQDDVIQKLQDAHQKYVDWWLPIDVAGGSFMAPMSLHRFCETLLTYDGGWGGTDGEQIENWWDAWMDEHDINSKTRMKIQILKLVIAHYTDVIDLNKSYE